MRASPPAANLAADVAEKVALLAQARDAGAESAKEGAVMNLPDILVLDHGRRPGRPPAPSLNHRDLNGRGR